MAPPLCSPLFLQGWLTLDHLQDRGLTAYKGALCCPCHVLLFSLVLKGKKLLAPCWARVLESLGLWGRGWVAQQPQEDLRAPLTTFETSHSQFAVCVPSLGPGCVRAGERAVSPLVLHFFL